MPTYPAKTKTPYAVSLALIFAYSVLSAVVPPTQLGADATLAHAPATQDASPVELVAQAQPTTPRRASTIR